MMEISPGASQLPIMLKNRRNAAILFLICLLFSAGAQAHKASDGFVYLMGPDNLQGFAVTGSTRPDSPRIVQLDLALRDLAVALPLDTDRDGQLTAAELRSAQPQILDYYQKHLRLHSESGQCQLDGLQRGLSSHSDGPYFAARYQIACPSGEAVTRVDYSALFDVDSLHRGLVSVNRSGQTQLQVIGPEQPFLILAEEPSGITTFVTFVREGVIHLLIGFDHLLFLIVLMLPLTLRGSNSNSGPTAGWGLRRRLLELASVVTAFTLAHSITLGLSALDILRPPINWIEAFIAFSITLTALNMFWSFLGTRTWLLAFGFGLIHGFGFASVLADLTRDTGSQIPALAGFNIGVELGQLAIVALVFPTLYWLANYRLYQRALAPGLALVIAAVGLYWGGERVMLL
mgnify:CR=1 FL=1